MNLHKYLPLCISERLIHYSHLCSFYILHLCRTGSVSASHKGILQRNIPSVCRPLHTIWISCKHFLHHIGGYRILSNELICLIIECLYCILCRLRNLLLRLRSCPCHALQRCHILNAS